jgi:hypothetical protein
VAGGAIRDSTRVSGSRRQRILLEPVTSTGEHPDLMANERDPEGNMLCPVCREVIRDPDLCPFMGDQRVHEQCWSSPFKPWNQ